MVVKLFLWMAYTHNSQAWVEWNIFFSTWVKQFQCFCHFKSHVYFVYLEHVWVIHCWNSWVFIVCIMCVHLTYWRGETLFISSVLFLLSHTLREGFVYVIHDLAFYTSCILSKFWSWVFLCWWHFYSYSLYVWCVLLSVSGNIIPFVNLWQKRGVKIGDMMDDSSIWFCHRIAKGGVYKFLLAWFNEQNGQWKQWPSGRTHRPSGR